jgi:hypothetical protein
VTPAEQIAKAFHDCYEKLAPAHSYETRKESAVPWEDVPENNRALMVAVVHELLSVGAIEVGDAIGPAVSAEQGRFSFSDHRSGATQRHLRSVSDAMDEQQRRRQGLRAIDGEDAS